MSELHLRRFLNHELFWGFLLQFPCSCAKTPHLYDFHSPRLCLKIPNLFKIGQKRLALYVKTQVSLFFVSGEGKSPQKCSLRVKRYQTVSPRAHPCVLCVSAAQTGRSSVKFVIGDFYEKASELEKLC